MNTHELAWAAGFFDGEGCTNFSIHKGNRRISLAVSQKARNAEILDRLRDAIGFGSVNGPYANRGYPYYVYNLSNFEQVQAAIALLWKFLGVVKRRQAREALLAFRSHVREV